ncbi:MAG: cytochrome c biogenesis protein CcsA, partial [Campylobacteraceae bacterium]|nr:cytochrome c biogenesis protein CcsA [Campylobacteraceae bacterium]
MKKIAKVLLGMPVVLVLLLLFAVASGLATFIENDFGTESTWAVVYASWWFALIQVWLGLSIIYTVFEYNLFRKDKLPSLIFHISFLFILIGSGLTRYYGFEGILHIREGQMENRVSSSEPFVQMSTFSGKEKTEVYKEKLISSLNIGNINFFELNMPLKDGDAKLEYLEFIPNAITTLVEDSDGEAIASFNITYKNQPKEVVMKEGDLFETPELIFVFSKTPKESIDAVKPRIYIYKENGTFFIRPSDDLEWFKMSDNSKGSFASESTVDLEIGKLYLLGDTNFAAKKLLLKGKESIVSAPNDPTVAPRPSALIAKLSYKNEEKKVAMYGHGRGQSGYQTHATVGGRTFYLEWGSKIHELPFFVELIEFQLDRYPGSMSPSSYASEVKVVDKEKSIEVPFRIYMNNVLDYRGFRLFQSSYDKDELGTVLSVNQDPGKWPTYLGYFLLTLGLFLNIINPKSRFQKLVKDANEDMITSRKKSKKSMCAVFLLGMFLVFTPQGVKAQEASNDALAKLPMLKKFDLKHADYFGKLLVQSADGRIKPIDTIAHDVLNKVYRKSDYHGLKPNQIILGMMASPPHWQTQPIIKLHHEELKKILGISTNATHASFNDFFEDSGEYAYKLAKYAEVANRKKPAERNLFDKDVLKVDERLNVCYLVYTGEIFRMIPKIGDEENTWYSPKVSITQFPVEEGKEVRIMLLSYFDAIAKGLDSGEWENANTAVDRIKAYQQQYGAEVIPQAGRVEMEIAFNKLAIFDKLTPVYLLAGFGLLLFIFARLAFPGLSLLWVMRIVHVINILAFTAHTIGLGLRWYIAQHAPWSNSYESMIYIAWALALSGIVFSRRSPISLALTAILAGITLFVAHLSWMDPQITTLVPVLKSHWLTIHVSVITASYGFLGLCSLLGAFTLTLLILRNPKKQNERTKEMDANIKEATRINEMAMTLGLSLLIVGNFLGAIWANESWGRYWGWDPKETWTLVSVLAYVLIIHFRFVPGLKS